MLGGGMRQIGYLAAAGIYALEHHVERLAEDHEHARLLADGIRACAGLRLKHDPPETNMVYFDALPPHTRDKVLNALKAEGLLIGNMGGTTFRAVPHVGISRADIQRAVSVIQHLFG